MKYDIEKGPFDEVVLVDQEILLESSLLDQRCNAPKVQ